MQHAIQTIEAVCNDFDGNGIFSVGAIGALRAMSHHWKDHLAEGHNPKIISEDIDEMKQQLEVMRAEIMRRLMDDPVGSTTSAMLSPAVSAEARDDNHAMTVKFDATPWFIQATDKQILDLADIEWSGDYAADAVAEHFENRNKEIAALLTLCRASQETREAHGFECSVDEGEAMAWLKQHRRSLWALLLCAKQGVSLVMAQEEEILGMWDWISTHGNACEHSFDTAGEAALNAIEVLKLDEVLS